MTALLVVVLALALRVGWVLLVPTKPVGDFAMYVESAAHFVKFGSFDSEYIFMPGYVFLLAAVQALGGGWLACKLVGAVAGSLAAGAVYGIARRLWDSRAAALVAGMLCALWPAGVAMSSVTGTDMPAAALISLGCYFLLRYSPKAPRLAAVLFGVFMGLATYIRAIALPLCALAVFCFRASGLGWKPALRNTAISCAVAALLLSPWALRNRLRYGETFVSDSHGGETALVGANPNTDGHYSRSLNRMFHEATGYTILAEPHREADRAALSLARRWMRFDPALPSDWFSPKPSGCWFTNAPCSTGRFSVPACCQNRRSAWPAVGVRHRVGGGQLLVGNRGGCAGGPRRGAGATALAGPYPAAVHGGPGRPIHRHLCGPALPPAHQIAGVSFRCRRARGWPRRPGTSFASAGCSRAVRWEAGLALGLIIVTFVGAPALAWAGGKLREHHRWAVQVCHVDRQARLCSWRRTGRRDDDGRPACEAYGMAWAWLSRCPRRIGRGRWPLKRSWTWLPATTPSRRRSTSRRWTHRRPFRQVNSACRSAGERSATVSLASVAQATRESSPLPLRVETHHNGGKLPVRCTSRFHRARRSRRCQAGCG